MSAKYAEMLVFVAVGVVTGILTDRERKRRIELETATDELRQTHAQLQSSVDQLRQADRLSAIGKLAAGLAHEIRNPLGSIEGAVDICNRTNDAEKRREFLGIIKKETNRLNTLLTTLLDFARTRTPQMRLVQIEGIVKGVTSLLTHDARQRGIHLKTSVPADLPDVECDAQQIQQALLNITLNALQATPSGTAVVLAASAHDRWLSVSVTDDGPGVDANMEQIFDPFFTTKEGGTGLGLSISLQILLQHGGRIVAERNATSGMTFTLRWPIRQNAVSAP
jgi:signal transduction histidine kinase